MTDFEEARDEAAAKHANGNYGSYHMDLQAFKAGADWARRELDADIHVNHCGHIVKWEDLCRRFDAANADLQKERDALKAEVERLKSVIAEQLSENDELGCEYTYVRILKDEVERLKAERHQTKIINENALAKRIAEERDALKAELKLYMQSEKIWQDNCGVAGRDALPKEREKSRRLAEALRYFISRCEGTHPDGFIQSRKTYAKFKQALEEFEGEKE